MRPSDILATPVYRDHLLDGLQRAEERQAEMFEAVEHAADPPEPPAAEPDHEPSAAEDRDSEQEESRVRTCPSCGRVVKGADCVHCI